MTLSTTLDVTTALTGTSTRTFTVLTTQQLKTFTEYALPGFESLLPTALVVEPTKVPISTSSETGSMSILVPSGTPPTELTSTTVG